MKGVQGSRDRRADRGPLVSLVGYPALFGATAVVATAVAIGVWQIKSAS